MPVNYNDVEKCAADVIVTKEKKVGYVSVYRPPNTTNSLTAHFCDGSTNLRSVTHEVCVVGDFNCNCLMWDNLNPFSCASAIIRDWNVSLSLHRLCTFPTKEHKLVGFSFAILMVHHYVI